MIIKKKFNNNVLLTTDKNGQEMVLIGNGLAFNSRPGGQVEEEKIEKIFRMDDGKASESFANFLINIPRELLDLMEKIIDHAEAALNKTLSKSVFLTLSDHLLYAVKRNREGVNISNPLLWEIKQFYPKEYHLALEVIDIINKELNVCLLEDEAGFVALHFVNGQQWQTSMHQTIQVPKVAKDIMSIVEYHFSTELNRDSVSYERFMVHLKFFAQRTILHEEFSATSLSMLDQLMVRFPKAYDCVMKINKYMKENYQVEITDDEKFYLMVHIQRVIEGTEN